MLSIILSASVLGTAPTEIAQGADTYQGARPLTFEHQPTDSPPLAILCGRLFTMADSNAIFDPGMLLIRNGEIEYVGKPVDIPTDYEVMDLGATWVTPGLVDLHSHIQSGDWRDTNDMVMPTNEVFSTRPAIVSSNPNMRRACAAGVTTLFGIPGSGTSISGFGVLYKTKTSASYEEIVLADPGGMKVAQTNNPERDAGDLGVTIAPVVANVAGEVGNVLYVSLHSRRGDDASGGSFAFKQRVCADRCPMDHSIDFVE